jgi:two-component system sensor histidine kinase CiaH
MATKFRDNLQSWRRFSMFRSARWQLTLFYLATLVVFSLTLTMGIRAFAEYELNQSFTAQQGEFRALARNGLSLLVPHPEDDFMDAQNYHARLARQHLNKDLLLLNLIALISGGFISYWFAGRTLKPIADAHEAQARFVADASHELRTPLANMRAENEVFLRAKHATDDETKELVHSNLEEIQRLENLSRDLLALSQYGQTDLPMRPVAIRTVLNEAVAQAGHLLKNRKVTVEQQVAAGTVVGHRESLVRLIVILLDNACKYGPEKGTIYVAGAIHGSHYILTVRDEGQGISAKDLPHIFDRLYRGDPARANTVSGYGLGLSLAKEITRLHRGDLKAYNARSPHRGAVFSLQLPLDR